MIYTLTLNPSLDYHITPNGRILPQKTNRTQSESLFIGGKGINVSTVLKELGIDSVCLGFVAGTVGAAIEKGLQDRLKTDFIHLESGESRINVKIREEAGITEINGSGPDISPDSLDKLFDRLSELSSDDMVIISGSAPQSLKNDIYGQIAACLADKGCSFVVDAASSLLMNTLKYHPDVIKPNIEELSQLSGTDIDALDADKIYIEAKKLQDMGAKEVIVSAGSFGAYLVDRSGELHIVTSYKGDVINTVGAGDSMLAGFIAGKKKGLASDNALDIAVAAGCACAFCDDLPKREDIVKLLGSDPF